MLWTPSWWLKGGTLGLAVGLAVTACGGDDDDSGSGGAAKAGKGGAGSGAGSSGRGGSAGKAGSANAAGGGSGGTAGSGPSAGNAGTGNVAGTAGTGNSGGTPGGGTGGDTSGRGGTSGVGGTAGFGGTPDEPGGAAGESGSGGEAGAVAGAAGAGGSGPEAVCGNGTVETGEDCDGSNTDNLDGCNSKCQSEVSAGPGLNAPIVDDAYLGTLVTMTCVDLAVVAKADGLVDSVSIKVGLTHGWVGDLTFKLVSPANTVVTLMSRPGLVEAADNGNGPGGDSSDLNPGFPISFQTGGPKTAENMGNTITATDTVCQADAACVYAPAAGAAAAGTLASFVGQAAVGTWRFCAADSSSGDVGSIDFVRLSVVQ